MIVLRERIAALTPRERAFLAAGAAALVAFLIYFLVPGEETGTEVVLADTPSAATPAPAPAPLPLPPTPIVSAGPPPAPMADPSAVAGIMLKGVTGGGPSGGAAIVALPGGTQRVVRIGREIVPGVMLREVGLRHAIASSGGGDIRFELNKAGAVTLASAAAPPLATAAAPPASSGRETLQYRLGLEPVKSGGRISGYSVRPGADLPHLQQAGLQPGDVIVGVNGSAFDEERLAELSWTIANSGSVEIDYLRGGKRMKARIAPQQRQ
jgi:general secretion pathway protein C